MFYEETKFKKTEIGLIPEDWNVYRIKNLGRVVTGKTPPTSEKDNYGGKIPFVCIPDMGQSVRIEKTSRYVTEKGLRTVKNCLLPKDSIMVSCIATIGKVALTSEPSITNQQINSIIPNKKVLAEFLYYRLNNFKEILSKFGGGGAVFEIVSKSKFKDIPLSMPSSLVEQQKIAEVLGALDEKIELNRKMNQTLEEIGQIIFDKYALSANKILAADLLSFEKGIEPGSKSYKSKLKGGINFFRVKDLFSGSEPEVKISSEFAKITSKLDDVLISFDGTVGRVAICCAGAFSSGIRMVRPKENSIIKNSLIYFYLKSQSTQEKIFEFSEGTTILHASKSIPHLEFPFNEDEIKSVQDNLDIIFQMIMFNLMQIKNLLQIRDSLLPKLMSGKLRIR